MERESNRPTENAKRSFAPTGNALGVQEQWGDDITAEKFISGKRAEIKSVCCEGKKGGWGHIEGWGEKREGGIEISWRRKPG